MLRAAESSSMSFRRRTRLPGQTVKPAPTGREKGHAMPEITPCLWFDTEGEEAARFYTSVFPNSRILSSGKSSSDRIGSSTDLWAPTRSTSSRCTTLRNVFPQNSERQPNTQMEPSRLAVRCYPVATARGSFAALANRQDTSE